MPVLTNTRQAHFAAVHGLDTYAMTHAIRLDPMQANIVRKMVCAQSVKQAPVTGSWGSDNRVSLRCKCQRY